MAGQQVEQVKPFLLSPTSLQPNVDGQPTLTGEKRHFPGRAWLDPFAAQTAAGLCFSPQVSSWPLCYSLSSWPFSVAIFDPFGP